MKHRSVRDLTKYLFVLLFVAATAVPVAAQTCGDDVERQLFEAHTWIALAEWYHDHPHCDDGHLAEHMTSQIGTWLAQDHPAFLKLSAAIAEHPEFELLVNWNLGGEYHSVKTLEAIAANAERKCPAQSASVCEHLLQTVRASLAANAARATRNQPGNT
jgi:hypothetical protein